MPILAQVRDSLKFFLLVVLPVTFSGVCNSEGLRPPMADRGRRRQRHDSPPRARTRSRRSPVAASSASNRPQAGVAPASSGDGLAWLSPVTDQRLRELLVDLPADLATVLVGLGPQTCEDVRGIWDTSQALVHELEDTKNRELTDGAIDLVRRFWTAARRAGLQARDEATRAVIMARQSSFPSRPLRGSDPPPEPEAPPRRARLMRDVGGPRMEQVATTVSGHTAHTREEQQKRVKLDSLFQLVIEHVVDLQSLGACKSDLEDPLKLQTLRDTVMTSSARLGVQRLSTLLSSFKRWLKFCEAQGVDAKHPTPMDLATFLRGVSQGGPTAASSMHACMKYFASTFGAAYDVDHWLTKTFRFHAQAHTSAQAPELEPWEFMNFIELFYRACGTQKLLLAMVLLPACACIRFEHLQRSSFTQDHGHWCEFHCSQGKSRKFGARPAYDWGLPEVIYKGQGIARTLAQFYQHEAKELAWLFPALALAPEDLWEITSTTAFILDKKMSRGRFLELLRGALCQSGLDVAAAQRATFNRLRRFVPTIANVMKLPALDLQAVGSWAELPQGGGADPQVAKAHAIIPMGLHYAGGKTARSAQVKQRCLCRLLQIFHARSSDWARSPEGLLVPHCWKWPEFEAMLQSIPEAVVEQPVELEEIQPDETPAEGRIEVAEGALPLEEEPDFGTDGEKESSPRASSGTSDTSSSSGSASDATADARDLLGLLEDDTAVSDSAWFRQAKKIHLVRECVDTRPSPWCRDAPFAQEPQERGVGFTSPASSSFCQKCLARMPRGLYAAYAGYFGWVH